MADDDDQWLEALAGRSDDSPAAREGAHLRRAMLSRALPDADVAQVDAERERALLERARREGLLVARRPRAMWPALAAAAALVLVVGVFVAQRSSDDAFVVRSADGGVRIEARDPTRLKRALLADLRAAGIDARGYERLGAEGIDAELPDALTPEMSRALERYRLAVPDDRVLRVEIVERER
jgi:hypothetical protein